jgi:hypothetical protein
MTRIWCIACVVATLGCRAYVGYLAAEAVLLP